MRHLRAAHTAHDISPRQFHLLGLLHDRGPMTQRDLGSVIDVDPSILVTLLNPLEASGTIARERDPADRRRHVVTLTEPGRTRMDASAQAQRDAENELLSGLSDEQRDQLRGLLLTLRDALAAECGSAQ
jgi:DNA-binding MarR family transcriptional regulator